MKIPERTDGLPIAGSSASLHWLLGWLAYHNGNPFTLGELFNNIHSRKHWEDGYLARKELIHEPKRR